MTKTGLHLYSEFRLSAEALESLEPSAFDDHIQQMLDEPGCTRAEVFRREDEDAVFLLIAVFENEDALRAHLEADFRLESVGKMRSMIEGGLRRFTMQRVA
jgi:quinol monooxygenase YgiN